MTNINESSLSRVWQHFSDPDTCVAILTAFRKNYSYEQNVARNRTLAAKIRNAKWGFIYVDGAWVEKDDDGNEELVKEDSILAIAPDNNKNFAQIIHDLGNQYDQDAVIVKDSKGTRLTYRDGSEQDIGEIRPGELGDVYTKMRTGRNKSSTFIFKEERDDIGWIARLAGLRK